MKIISTVHRPELTDGERAKRLKEIKQAAVELVLANEKRKARSERK